MMKVDIDIPQSLSGVQRELKSRFKPFYKSKTFWANLGFLASSLFEITREYLAANPEQALTAAAVINILLRLVTRHELTLRKVDRLPHETINKSED